VVFDELLNLKTDFSLLLFSYKFLNIDHYFVIDEEAPSNSKPLENVKVCDKMSEIVSSFIMNQY
jgi:hypothetical protein